MQTGVIAACEKDATTKKTGMNNNSKRNLAEFL